MKILVVAPQPDDKTLGCGGTLFRHKFEQDDLYWLIITSISECFRWDASIVKKR